MQNQFLRLVARAFVNNTDLDMVFVLPNRRSLKFFQKYLGIEYGLKYQKPFFAPELITINEFFVNLSGLKLLDNIELLYKLYEQYLQVRYKDLGADSTLKKESFDEFVHWGDIILKDFNDIDKYMVNAYQLFTNIKDLKEIENEFSYLSPNQLEAIKCFWTNFLNGNKFSGKKEFFSTNWAIMYQLYTNFRESLKKDNMAYEGLVYREVAENISNCKFQKKVVFIGFNAPNNCEKCLMSYLKQVKLADFYWDFYGEMLCSKQNSASEIIRECVSKYPSLYEIEDSSLKPQEQNINVYGSPSGVGQAFVVAKILNELFTEEKPNAEKVFSTAVVLPDENLLMPVLNSIPEKFKTINVTMGYPITTTAFISFMTLVENLLKDAKIKDGKCSFYYKSVLELISHEYIKTLANKKAEAIRKNIIGNNLIFIPVGSEFLGGGDDILSLFFTQAQSSKEIADYLKAILKELDLKLSSWDREFVYQYYTKLNKLSSLNIPMNGTTFFRLLSQLTSDITVPFRGEPLAGLQVMGTLETRALDFENIIIISANEGKFPSSSISDSLIPYNLRVGFALPTYQLQDGIAAYHFYRSICRAKNVYMIYDTRREDFNSGEVSRYVKQMEYHFNVKIHNDVISSPINIVSEEKIHIDKSEKIMLKLVEMFSGNGARSLSASAINEYLACPIKFYFDVIERVKEDDEVKEEIESNTFGTIFHYVMQMFYKEYEGKTVTKEIIEQKRKDIPLIESLIIEGFKNELKRTELRGQDIIVKELIKKYVMLSLREDISLTPFKYVKGEKKFCYKLPIYNGKYNINFKAFIDRIDVLKEGNLTRLVDYKTGVALAPQSNFLIKDLFDTALEGKYKAILQLYLYGLIYFSEKENLNNEDILALLTIYPLKKINKEHLIQHPLKEADLKEFKDLLVTCVEEIFNPDIPFYANSHSKTCEYCNLSVICGK